jgi:hypothetical protein
MRLPTIPPSPYHSPLVRASRAAGNTLAKMLSALPATGGKRTRIMIYDVHAPPTQYFFTGTCACTMHTACPLAVAKIQQMAADQKITCVAFPDDGACKRFAKFFQKHGQSGSNPRVLLLLLLLLLLLPLLPRCRVLADAVGAPRTAGTCPASRLSRAARCAQRTTSASS